LVQKLGRRFRSITGLAIKERRAVIVGDVRNDPRYLAAFESTLSELIVPVLSPDGRVLGTIDARSERADAFSSGDLQRIEQCAQAALPIWLLR
jgi:L-methionine (R)-S-oxide reductase